MDFGVSSSIGEKEDSNETQFAREPPATVQVVAEVQEVVVSWLSISSSCVSMFFGLISVVMRRRESCLMESSVR